MKKNILGFFILFCIGLLASCSDDDNQSVMSDRVCISAKIPEELGVTGGMPTGYKLRCILEIRDEKVEPVYREELMVESTESDILFDFNIPQGTYHCLMWADYVDAAASIGTDNYFVTSDLTNVTVKDARSLINNTACEAFFYSGEIQKGGEALNQEIELASPFAKVSVREKKIKELSKLKTLTVGYSTPVNFNVSTGQVTGENAAVSYTDAAFNAAVATDGTLFTTCVLADEESPLFGNISLNFVTEAETYNAIVPQIIPLQPGRHIKVSGHLMTATPDVSDFEIDFDMDVDDWGDSDQTVSAVETKAKVGDFFYADGSYSSTYMENAENPCIGVVFAVAHDDGKALSDNPDNYVDINGVKKLKEVHGWVIAAKDITGDGNKKIAPAVKVEAFDLAAYPGKGLADGKSDIAGFRNTEAFKNAAVALDDYPIAGAIIGYETASATKAPAGTSGWYWGAVKQYLTLAEEYAKVTVEGGVVTAVELQAVGKAMQLLSDKGVGEMFSLDGEQFYFSSTTERAKASDAGKLYRVGLSVSGKNYGQTAAWRTNDGRHARAVLTF